MTVEHAKTSDQPDETFSFAEMDLRPGARLHMEVLSQPKVQRYWVNYIGCIEGRELLISPPHVDGFPLPLKRGTPLTLTAFSYQRVYRFSTWLKHVCRIPFDYLDLSFPEQISAITLRGSPRLKLPIRVQVRRMSADQAGNEHEAVISDLSEGGALIETSSPMGETSEQVKLSFELRSEGSRIPMLLSARIRKAVAAENQIAGSAEVTHRYGVEFLDVDEKDKLRLQGFIYKNMLFNPKARA